MNRREVPLEHLDNDPGLLIGRLATRRLAWVPMIDTITDALKRY
jgi:hypothetical protein